MLPESFLEDLQWNRIYQTQQRNH